MTSPSIRAVVACGAAVLMAAVVYVNVLDNPFVYDDVRSVVENRSIVPPIDARAVLAQNVTRPLVNVSYVIDRALWGPAPFGFHLTSVVLHLLNVALLFGLTSGVVSDRLRERAEAGHEQRVLLTAFTAAALFAVHPMMTEAVGYISARAEILAATFMLTSLVAVRCWMNTDRMRWLGLALTAMFLALAAKETAIVLPLLCLYYVMFVRDDALAYRRRHLVMLCGPLLAIAIVGASARLGLFVYVEYAGRVGWQWRFALTELDVFTRYLSLMIAPSGQTIFHGIPATTSFADPRALVAIGTSVLAVALIVLSAWRRSIVGFGLTWFVLMLVPSALLVLLDRGEPMAERRVYFASAGLFLAAGHAVGGLGEVLAGTRALTRRAVAAVGVVVLMALAGRTVVRNTIWSNPILLWTEAAERAPGHWLPPLVLGESLHDAGRHDDAIAAFRRALVTGPNVPAIYENLGLCLLEMRRVEDAKVTFTALTAQSPHSAAGLNGLAMTELLQGNVEAARRGFLAALDVDPRSVEARRGLVLIEERPGGNPAEALRRCEEIHLLAPDAPGARDCIARHQSAAAP